MKRTGVLITRPSAERDCNFVFPGRARSIVTVDLALCCGLAKGADRLGENSQPGRASAGWGRSPGMQWRVSSFPAGLSTTPLPLASAVDRPLSFVASYHRLGPPPAAAPAGRPTRTGLPFSTPFDLVPQARGFLEFQCSSAALRIVRAQPVSRWHSSKLEPLQRLCRPWLSHAVSMSTLALVVAGQDMLDFLLHLPRA